MDRFSTIWVPEGTDVRSMLRELEALGEMFELVELDWNGSAQTPPVNDPHFPQQWHLLNTGQNIDGTIGVAGADIKAPEAWVYAPMLSPIVVAVLDTGVSQSHPDLLGIQLPGRNLVNATTPTLTDDNTTISHGTYCAGVVAALPNNSIGVAGVAPNARILPVKTLQSIQIGSQTTCANGLTWAADNGARVASISASWGSASATGALATAVAYAAVRNLVVCASTGNTPGVSIGYPARWSSVIAVGGTSSADLAWSGGTTGIEIDVVAPADNILTTSDDNSGINGYSRQTGTSLSCPMAAAVVALILGVNPDLTAEQARDVLFASVDDLGPPGWDEIYGHGRINALRAVQAARATLPCPLDADGNGIVDIEDVFAFVDYYLEPSIRADFDGNGLVNLDDLFLYLQGWFVGC